jgi:hypothetical protein
VFSGDIIGLEGESFQSAEPALVPVMRNGQRLEEASQDPKSAVQAAQAKFLASRESLPPRLLRLGIANPPYPVSYSTRLEDLCQQTREALVKTAQP